MLNENQQKAATTLDGQLLIVACPGSGKTTVVVDRTHNLIESGVAPQNILVITFTNQAANEMKARFEKKYGTSQVLFGTIHSLCYRVLSKRYGYTREDILKPAEQWDFIRTKVIEWQVQTDDMENFIKGILSEISYVRNLELDPSTFSSQACKSDHDFVRLFRAYKAYKEDLGKVDFDDMLFACRDVLREEPEVLEYWKKQYTHIMIDEYQDTNRVQADIFYMLAGEHGNLCVVGDDDQSIYKFRAADSSIMLDFPEQFPDCATIHLDTNYRSQPVIAKHCENLIKNNQTRFSKDFKAFRTQEDGEIRVLRTEGANEEALAVLKMIEEYHKKGIDYSEMAVLYRTNAQNLILVGKLMKYEVPFYTTEPPKDYHNEFIFGDLMAYGRLADGSWKKGDAQRILNRPARYLKSEPFKNLPYNQTAFLEACNVLGSKKATQAKVQVNKLFQTVSTLSSIKTPYNFVKHLAYADGYRGWLKDYCKFCKKDPDVVEDLFDILMEESKGFSSMEEWQEYADFYALELEKKRRDRKKNGVCLSTFHSAKGLEWKVVIIIDADEGITPTKKAESDEDYEEERRAFYVAATRAKDHLDIMYTCSNGKTKNQKSRYIAEMQLEKEEETPQTEEKPATA
jgi:DNA helicase-2/ATP-dependent DNA helicase PcrA